MNKDTNELSQEELDNLPIHIKIRLGYLKEQEKEKEKEMETTLETNEDIPEVTP